MASSGSARPWQVASKAAPFAAGIALAGVLFAFFGWDLWHHYVTSPGHPAQWLDHVEVYLSVLALLGARGLYQWRVWRSRDWPRADATIENVAIAFGKTQGSEDPWQVTASYWYLVNGERYGGVYTEGFRSEAAAQAKRDRLKGSHLAVRYRADHPDESVMTAAD